MNKLVKLSELIREILLYCEQVLIQKLIPCQNSESVSAMQSQTPHLYHTLLKDSGTIEKKKRQNYYENQRSRMIELKLSSWHDMTKALLKPELLCLSPQYLYHNNAVNILK